MTAFYFVQVQTRMKAAAYRLGGIDLEFLFRRKDADNSGVRCRRHQSIAQSIVYLLHWPPPGSRTTQYIGYLQALDREEFLSLVRKDLRIAANLLSDKEVQV